MLRITGLLFIRKNGQVVLVALMGHSPIRIRYEFQK